MQLKQPFLKLPIEFCAETLAAEVRALPSSAWMPHPQRFAGNEAVPLITPGGEITDAIEGAKAPTEHLQRCPYMREIMSEIGAVWGRSRLMGLGAGANVPVHVDIDYYWRTHFRIHIPVITNPGVQFTCSDETIHMAAGECWVFDTFRRHGVRNAGSEQRVHLVLDTVGGEGLWELMTAAQENADRPSPARLFLPGQARADDLAFEQISSPKVMTPWEIRCHLAFVSEQAIPDPELQRVEQRLDKFATEWAAAWSRFGERDEGRPTYLQLIGKTRHDLHAIGATHIKLANDRPYYLLLDRLIFANALASQRPPQPSVAANQRRVAV